MFIPLVWAAVVAMLFHRIVARSKVVATVFGIVVIVMFGHMVLENRPHYSRRVFDYGDAASITGAAGWWPQLESGEVYCTVGIAKIPFMMTGPTLTEYEIVERTSPDLCPAGSLLVTPEGISESPAASP